MDTFSVTFADGRQHAEEDVKEFGLKHAKDIDKSLINNPSFPEVYKQGYSTEVKRQSRI